MVFPILGARDYIDPKGYILQECPQCGVERVFSIYDTRRKLTLYFVPTLNVRSQHVMECTTCHGRWGIPDNERALVDRHLMTQEEVSLLIHRRQVPQMPARQRTFYQVLQVDPAAERDVIEAAFRRLALRSHPDRDPSPEASGRMRELITARDLLLDEVRRAEYDRSLGFVRRVEAVRPEEV